jgi:hypothetical protein
VNNTSKLSIFWKTWVLNFWNSSLQRGRNNGILYSLPYEIINCTIQIKYLNKRYYLYLRCFSIFTNFPFFCDKLFPILFIGYQTFFAFFLSFFFFFFFLLFWCDLELWYRFSSRYLLKVNSLQIVLGSFGRKFITLEFAPYPTFTTTLSNSWKQS